MSVSRQTADAAIQDVIETPNVETLTCPVLLELFFDPMMSVPCGHLIESDAKDKLESPGRCPCCRESVLTWIPCPPILRGMLESNLQKALLLRDADNQPVVTHDDIHFNINQFAKIVNQKKVVDDKGKTTQEEGLKTPTGLRFIALLENASKHLNQKPVTRTESTNGTVTESVGKSRINCIG